MLKFYKKTVRRPRWLFTDGQGRLASNAISGPYPGRVKKIGADEYRIAAVSMAGIGTLFMTGVLCDIGLIFGDKMKPMLIGHWYGVFASYLSFGTAFIFWLAYLVCKRREEGK